MVAMFSVEHMVEPVRSNAIGDSTRALEDSRCYSLEVGARPYTRTPRVARSPHRAQLLTRPGQGYGPASSFEQAFGLYPRGVS
jgi:hypothetical protein